VVKIKISHSFIRLVFRLKSNLTSYCPINPLLFSLQLFPPNVNSAREMSKPPIKISQQSHIVKIAVELEGRQAQLIEFNQTIPLAGIIQQLANEWKLLDSENYALKFCEQNNKNYDYVTEKNRNEVKNGSVLKLFHSPSKAANDILNTLRTGSPTDITKELENLSTLSSDITFALEFIKEKGMDSVIEIIEFDKGMGDMLIYALLSFIELMDNGNLSWDILTQSFINRIIQFLNLHGQIPKEVIESALSILENIVQSSSNASLVERSVTFDNLLKLLNDSSSSVVQQNSIALTNALFIKGDASKRIQISDLFATKGRNVILTNVIGNGTTIGSEMAHQLYVLQTLTLGLLERRMMTSSTNNLNEVHDNIRELLRVAFDDSMDGSSQEGTNKRHSTVSYKKLGFRSDVNPASDFSETPPGILALDCMIYFARHYAQNYTKVVHENSCRNDEKECPFGRTSIELVKLLCEILKIGDTPLEQGTDFHQMFFTHDHAFEEFYCISILVLYKTWKDMRATSEDFQKVFSVVKEQVGYPILS
jgi:engulfment and cell motility protein 1